MPSITLGILSYNRPHYLVEAIESALAQTIKPEKIIVFDNGSNQEVFNAIKHLINHGVEWEHLEKNHGPKYILEKAVNECNTDLIMILHDDDRLHSNFLEVQLGLFVKHTSLVALSCNGNLINSSGMFLKKTISEYQKKSQNIQIYKSPIEVALKYASNSCIPYSPTIYKTKHVIKSRIREEFKKCADAVFLCDLSHHGHFGYTTFPLYDCRTHPGQDSARFPLDQMQKLEEYFLSLTCIEPDKKDQLNQLLIRRHTLRNIKISFEMMKSGRLNEIPPILVEKKFNIYELFKEIFVRIIKYRTKYQ